jgi:hypothetical protein
MTPENSGWYQAAYAVAIVVMAAYVASLWWRGRHLRK